MEKQTVDQLSTEYIALRTQREILAQNFKVSDEELKAKMSEIEQQLLEILNQTEAGSISTDTATVIRSVSRTYSTTNWDALYKMIAEHKAFGLLTKRIHNVNMKQFLEENPDEFPAGLNVDSRYAVTVRRKSAI